MAIKELVDQVRSQLSSEESEKVGAFLEQIKNEAQALSDAKSASDSESKSRKLKIRDLEEKVENLELDIGGYKKKIESFDTTELEKERDTFKTKYSNLLKREQGTFISSFDKIKDHPKFEKAKAKFVIPEFDEEKKEYKWDSLKTEDLEKNVESLNELNQLDYFADESTGGSPSGGKGTFPKVKEEVTHEELQEIKRKYGAFSDKYNAALKKRVENMI